MNFVAPQISNTGVNWSSPEGESFRLTTDGMVEITKADGSIVRGKPDADGNFIVDHGGSTSETIKGGPNVVIPLVGGMKVSVNTNTGEYSYTAYASAPTSRFIGPGIEVMINGNFKTGINSIQLSANIAANLGVLNGKIAIGLSVDKNGEISTLGSLSLSAFISSQDLLSFKDKLEINPNNWLENDGIFGDGLLGNAYQLLASRQMYLDGMISGAIPEGISHQEWLDRINAAAELKIDPNIQIDANAIEQSIVRRDPLVFDLDGDGIETVSSDAGIIFDHDGDGIKHGTGWVGANDGLLALDINGNGIIDSGKELFGDNTVLSNGEKARDGFAALRDLDINGDGVIDNNDVIYEKLKIWQDINQDGISQASEIKSLAELNIKSIALNDTSQLNKTQNGNVISHVSNYFDTEGKSHVLGTLDFSFNGFYREFNPIEISESAKGVVDFKGSGGVRDLREAATKNSSLLDVYNKFSSAESRDEQEVLIDELIMEWASSEDNFNLSHMHSTIEAVLEIGHGYTNNGNDGSAIFLNSSQYYQRHSELIVSNLGELAIESSNEFKKDYFSKAGQIVIENMPVDSYERMLFILELFNGRNIRAGQGTLLPQVSSQAHDQIRNAYENLKENIFSSLVFSTRLSHISDAILVRFDSNKISYDMSLWQAELIKLIESEPVSGIKDVLSALDYYQPYISQSTWSKGAFISLLLSDILPEIVPDNNISDLFPSEFVQELIESQETIILKTNTQVAVGSDSSDTIKAAAGTNSDLIILGMDGDDILYGSNGNDHLEGGRGDDLLYAGLGADSLFGNEGNDTLSGHYASNNLLDGGEGDDTLKLNSLVSNA
ncbi:hypothetical protein HG547_13760, partial [Shewanella sp. DNRA4]|uniref:calcium-binding protein n=1 Tax=Shewanella sp. DNRA4 TaxID=2723055 RepID=UPI0017C057EC